MTDVEDFDAASEFLALPQDFANTDFQPESIPSYNREDRRAEPAVYMPLRSSVKTLLADLAIRGLASTLYDRAHIKTRPTAKYVAALAAAVADLLKAGQHKPIRPCYRPMTIGDFSGCEIGYRPFRRVVDHLETQRYIKVEKGEADPNTVTRQQDIVTRIRPMPKLFNDLALRGLNPASVLEHFVEDRSVAPGELIRLKSSKLGFNVKDRDGRPIKVNRFNPTVIKLAKEVAFINDFVGKQSIEGADHYGFFRGFNLGDDPTFNWNKGGRLYSRGGGYQQGSKADRLAMRINGQPVVELDINGSHLAIAHGLMSMPLPNDTDIYAESDLSRHIVKMWIGIALGFHKIPERWSPRSRATYLKEFGKSDLQKAFPVQQTGSRILETYPIIEDYIKSNYCWADLQFIESEILISTIITLINDFKVPSLPVHDSIIVPKPNSEIALKIFKDKFHEQTGIYPIINIKRG